MKLTYQSAMILSCGIMGRPLKWKVLEDTTKNTLRK